MNWETVSTPTISVKTKASSSRGLSKYWKECLTSHYMQKGAKAPALKKTAKATPDFSEGHRFCVYIYTQRTKKQSSYQRSPTAQWKHVDLEEPSRTMDSLISSVDLTWECKKCVPVVIPSAFGECLCLFIMKEKIDAQQEEADPIQSWFYQHYRRRRCCKNDQVLCILQASAHVCFLRTIARTIVVFLCERQPLNDHISRSWWDAFCYD